MGGEVLLLRTVRLASHTLDGLPMSGGLAFFTDSERERGERLFVRSVEIPRNRNWTQICLDGEYLAGVLCSSEGQT